jgi:hypothetical protein
MHSDSATVSCITDTQVLSAVHQPYVWCISSHGLPVRVRLTVVEQHVDGPALGLVIITGTLDGTAGRGRGGHPSTEHTMLLIIHPWLDALASSHANTGCRVREVATLQRHRCGSVC